MIIHVEGIAIPKNLIVYDIDIKLFYSKHPRIVPKCDLHNEVDSGSVTLLDTIRGFHDPFVINPNAPLTFIYTVRY